MSDQLYYSKLLSFNYTKSKLNLKPNMGEAIIFSTVTEVIATGYFHCQIKVDARQHRSDILKGFFSPLMRKCYQLNHIAERIR